MAAKREESGYEQLFSCLGSLEPPKAGNPHHRDNTERDPDDTGPLADSPVLPEALRLAQFDTLPCQDLNLLAVTKVMRSYIGSRKHLGEVHAAIWANWVHPEPGADG